MHMFPSLLLSMISDILINRYISRFARGTLKITTNVYKEYTEETRVTGTTRDRWMFATLDYSGRILKNGAEICKLMRRASICRPKIKVEKLFYKIIQGFLALFVSSGLQPISYLSAQNVRPTSAKLNHSLQTSTAVRNG